MKIIQKPDSINDITFSLKDYPLLVLVNVFCGYVLTFSFFHSFFTAPAQIIVPVVMACLVLIAFLIVFLYLRRGA